MKKFSLYIIILFVIGCSKEINPKKIIPVKNGPDAVHISSKKYLYVANVEDEYISVIDIYKEILIKNIKVAKNPWGLIDLNDGRIIVSSFSGVLSIINENTLEVIKEKSFNQIHLAGITKDHNNQFLYVVANNINKVLKINIANLEIEEKYQVGNSPDGIGISSNNQYLYVSNTKDGTISIIDIKNKKIENIKVGGKPEIIHENDKYITISNFITSEVYVFDSNNKEKILTVKNLDGPEASVLFDNKLFIVNYKRNNIKVFNIKGEFLNIEYRTQKNPIDINIYNNKIYVSNYGDNSISIFNL
ncbi:MAG: hypothetical protein KatS3mg129_1512 [Leptospiraceae bacterium]|nr:MAG: hypothetical protein KatS3mg129_1512 [Leptospiraceae bacterium]